MIYPGAFQGRFDHTVDLEIRGTHRGLGPHALRESEAEEARREEEHWVALVSEGLVCLDTIPSLGVPRAEVRWTAHDETEVHVLLRVDSGCSLRALIETAPFPESDMVRALCRLARRGLVRIT